jgi:hypothetical protein
MIIRTLCSLSVAFAALFLASGSAAAQKGPALPDILKLAADYLRPRHIAPWPPTKSSRGTKPAQAHEHAGASTPTSSGSG